MKIPAPLFLLPVLMAVSAPLVFGAEVVILDWEHSWDYMHPMGTGPVNGDPDYNTTWFLNAPAFATTYNGPTFGGPAQAGTPGNIATYDHGTGQGPIGYGAVPAMEYFNNAGAEMTALRTTLSMPASGSRYTAYFRTTFTTTQAHRALRIRGLIDDSALIYLDGVLVARVNKADNTEAYTNVGADGVATRNENVPAAQANNEDCIQSILLAVPGNAVQAEAVVIRPVEALPAGQHTLAVSVQNAAATSSDCGFGLQFRGDDATITAVVSNIQRQENGAGFADDTFTFDVNVQPANLPPASVSWTSDNSAVNGPATGFYGLGPSTYTWPAQADIGTLKTVTIKYTDTVNPAITSTITVTAPLGTLGPETVLSEANPTAGTAFEEAALGVANFPRQIFSSELAFTSNGKVFQDHNANGSGSKMLRFNAVDALMTTEAVKLDPAVKGIKASATVRTFTNSASAFEPNDSLRISVEGSADGVAWTDIGAVLPTLTGNDTTTPNPAGIDQLLVKLGTGAIGEPKPRSHRGWNARGYPTGTAPMQYTDSLTVPSFTVPDAQPVRLEFTHRYSFERDPDDNTRYDGGDVQVSVNGLALTPVPGTAFTEHGYDGIITGENILKTLEGFNTDSPGYSNGEYVTSVLTIPGVTAGDSVQVQFIGGWDYNLAGYRSDLQIADPNWEITDIKVKSGDTLIYTQDFAFGNGTLTGTSGWVFDAGTVNPGPAYHHLSRSAIPVPAGVQYVRLKLSEPTAVVLSTSEFYLVDNFKLEVGLDPLADADGDGTTNGFEDIAGTNPADPLSVFSVTTTVAEVAESPGTWRTTLTFPAADFRTWMLQSSDDLQSWTTVDTRYGDPLVPMLSLFGDSSAAKKYWRVGIGY